MVNEVETILNEIRERVRVEEEKRVPVTLAIQDQESPAASEPKTENASREPESLARVSAHLTTTARAWDRLPPIFSNRRGRTAQFELWIKARFKSLTRWFTWEQVNFNAAVHHALTDVLATLSAHEQQLIAIRAELTQEAAGRRLKLKEIDRELQKLRAGLEAQTAAMEEANAATARISTMVSDLASETRTGFSQLGSEINARLAEMAADLREEQRVCFKQVSLEAGEAAVLEDRGRRAVESRLEKLEKTKDLSGRR